MAVRSTKPKSRTRTKKKPTVKKNTTKRKTRKRLRKSNFKKNIFVVLSVLFTISLVAFGYFLGNNNPSEKSTRLHSKTFEENKYLNDISKTDITEAKVIKQKQSSVKLSEVKKVEKKQLKVKPQKRVEIERQKQQKKQTVLISSKAKPRLAIVIDDVSTKAQMRRIQGTGLKLTPSIFPPSELSMMSHKLASSLEHYMVHLPMESGNKQFNTHHKTLMVHSSMGTIENRVKEIRRLFPKAKYINNHTGSIFTADYSAMYKLYKALSKQGFVFMDSRTTSSSKVGKITSEFGHTYIARDIFIDNEHTIPYIHEQLKKAVKFAKKRGYAVAIGHPHKVTMDALALSKDILNDVELVYIDEIF